MILISDILAHTKFARKHGSIRLEREAEEPAFPMTPSEADETGRGDEESRVRPPRRPTPAWGGMRRRGGPFGARAPTDPAYGGNAPLGAFSQRQWMPSMDVSDPSFHLPPSRRDRPAEWESALNHDSIDLLDMYLQDFRADNTVRGQMLLDLMDQSDPIAVRKMAKAWLEVANDDQWNQLIEPYVGMMWRPLNNSWEAGEPEGGVLSHKGLDPIIWKCRSKGLSPPVRRAIVRDLMSQPSDDAYQQLITRLMRILDGYIQPGNNTKEMKKAALEKLAEEYMTKTDFCGMPCVSEAAIEGVVKGMSTRGPTVMNLMREIRKCADQTSFETLLQEQAYSGFMTRGYNA